MGRSSIDLYAHEIGEPIANVKSFDAYVGGCPTNVSVGTRRLGLRSVLLTAVGDDQVGDFVTAFLEREQVDTRFIPRKPGRRTSAVVLTIQPPDRFPLTFYRDNCADRALTADDVARAPIAGVPIVVDLDYRGDQWHSASAFAGQIRDLLEAATIAIGTEEELAAASGTSGVADGAATLFEDGVDALVLKRGARGSTVFRDGQAPADVAPFPIEVLNVLGAGDAFASGFLYGYLQGWPLERAARMGNACGAIVVTRHGCANFMPTLDEVAAFVSGRGEPPI
jgi:5-dehydro-2-deoxygluconokinase